ncbi:hypothetical protein THAOC_37713 [Thalassiosira oceanica]|uniref:Uncharacterized protein n=1 Tax=Thalassiosira oceanica TaxID=159749 RepID=K0QYH8_THAOC|nr:hypothetical protein THAOC_37713 [Thalassiosira oceanica]|eukprot:EJK43805.1 hypothetical protein THAOC_37713 [Thalassiosira oceanica]
MRFSDVFSFSVGDHLHLRPSSSSCHRPRLHAPCHPNPCPVPPNHRRRRNQTRRHPQNQNLLPPPTPPRTRVAATVVGRPDQASAGYGADAKIELPDVIQGMSDRQTKQCLVESLGNRECLVYLDPDNQLYKGSEATLFLERLNGSMNALQDLPTYIETKQWNKVQGVMTGPMGTLSLTMNELVKTLEPNDPSREKCKSLSIAIRNDLYSISGFRR